MRERMPGDSAEAAIAIGTPSSASAVSPASSSALRACIRSRKATRSMPARRHFGNISICSSTTWWVMYSPSTLTLAS